MRGGFDLFATYRWLLAIVCTVYTMIQLARSIHGWLEWFWAPHRLSGALRHYAMVQALRIRVSRFTVELVQLAALVAAFFGIVWLHRYLGFVE